VYKHTLFEVVAPAEPPQCLMTSRRRVAAPWRVSQQLLNRSLH